MGGVWKDGRPTDESISRWTHDRQRRDTKDTPRDERTNINTHDPYAASVGATERKKLQL